MIRSLTITLVLLFSKVLFGQVVTFDFEDFSLQQWNQSPPERWGVTASSPLVGIGSLKHGPADGADTDRISIPLPSWDESMGSIRWRFKVNHGYNPTSGNHWAVFLSSDKDAAGMIAAEAPNGYAVGVNLTGSDDILRLYRVSSGTFSSILSTGINWETEIKTTGVGAVEVERKIDGTFVVKASTTGSYLNLTYRGEVIDDTHPIGGYLGIYYRYTASAAGRFLADDIELTYKPVNFNDHLGQVVEPVQQVAGGVLSSIITSQEVAVEVMWFVISEQGSTDGLPIKPTKLRFTKVSSPNAANWSTTIGGVKLTANGVVIPVEAVYITDASIELEINEGDMIVADNVSQEFALWMYLKPENIADGATIQLRIDNTDHQWEAHHEGSDFVDNFLAPILSNVFTITVIPTHLSFASYPNPLIVNQPFTVIAHASDIEGNLAKSFNGGAITLGVLEGDGVLDPQDQLVSSAVNGVITWNDITYTTRDILKLSAEGTDLVSAETGAIEMIYEPSTVVKEPVEQVAGGPVSSSINTLGKAIEVFRFNIFDTGQYDGVPTHVRQIFIKRPTGLNLASFSTNIGGVMLKVNDQVLPIGNPHILTASISIPVPADALVIPDGQSGEVSLWIYLTSNGLTDGTNLRFMVDAATHNFIADDQGSTFNPAFPLQVNSAPFTIDVKATRLNFSVAPQYVGFDEPFSVEVSAVDAGGSIDVNATGAVTLSKNLGDGFLQIPNPSVNLTGGKATWTGLTYSYFTPGPFNLLASSVNFDDAVSALIYCSDRNTKLLQPLTPLENGDISALAITREDAVEVLRFRISDSGSSDKLPTRITQMIFRSQEQGTNASLSKAVEGVVLLVDNQEVLPNGVSITPTAITLTFSDGIFSIPDGETVAVSLKAFLKSGGQVDGSTISLHVPSIGHGWQTSLLGSGFPANFDASLVGPTITIGVVGSALSFFDQPFIAAVSQPINLTAVLTDALGNMDLSSNANATLLLDYGPGAFSVPSETIALADGFANWDGVMLSAIGKYRFRVVDELEVLSQGFSQPIWSGGAIAHHINENFEELMLSVPLSEHWDVSTVSPIDGARSLKHALSGVAGESRLELPLEIENLNDSPMEWSFVMRNGAWDPSPDNTFWFVLASDNTSIQVGDFNGYVLGVNLAGSDDMLTLWRVDTTDVAHVLIQSTFDWDEGETVFVRVTRTPSGEWSLWYQSQYRQSAIRLAGRVDDTQHRMVLTCGPTFKYTASRAGEFWLDNLKVSTAGYPPVISKARLANLTTVDIDFSKAVINDDARMPTRYQITDEQGVTYSVVGAYPSSENPTRVSLRTQELPLKQLQLRASGIRSAAGGTTVNDSITIGLGAAGTFGNLIINEVMARPSPVVGLPNVEYVELFNRTDKAISLNGWRFRGNNNYVTIPDGIVEPNGYLLLSGTTGATAMAQYGTAIGITSFPTLLVGGMLLAIYDNNNNLISWVEYSDTWYRNETQKAGGYSLERIDPNNLAEGAGNWIASSDITGGTPGRVNSAIATNPDQINPWVTDIKVISPTQIEVGYSEPMDSLSITRIGNYTVSKGIGSPIWAQSFGPRHNRVSLTLENTLAVGEIYDICFNTAIVDFSQNSLVTSCMFLAVHQEPAAQDIVINEILFNPYTGGADFVEIFNRSDKNFDLSQLFIANRNRTTLAINENFVAAGASWYLFPNSYAVLSVDPVLVAQFYFVENPDAMVLTPRMPAYPNDNGYVVLQTEQGVIVDEFAYTDKMHNPLLADPKGISLERINPAMPTHVASSWQSAAQTSGFATPTGRNSQFTDPTQVDDAFTLSHQVFSPDGDGFEDYLLISYELPEDGYIANIMVFDSRGRRVRRLAANMPLGTSGNLKWDGFSDAGAPATIGAYVIFIEAFDLRGNVKRYKKTVVVATRLR
ncbi:MAG: lamin tail domain-containing protein [Tenuifilaceae bacterium]|jgi:hypothetical protein|nr:lamin tail domain-containing protein [Tenuifilaceae bacterium]